MVFPLCGDFECDSDDFKSELKLGPNFEPEPEPSIKNKVEIYLFSCKDKYYKLFDGPIKINLTITNGGLSFTLLREYNHYSIGWCVCSK